MSSLDAALVKEQGVTFAVVAVQSGTTSSNRRDAACTEFSRSFNGAPVVLMEQDSSGRPRYYGRTDLVKFCSNLHVEQLPWKRWSLN